MDYKFGSCNLANLFRQIIRNLNVVLYRLSGTTLLERLPDIGAASGAEFTEYTIVENVSQFRVERLAPNPNDRAVLVDITLELTTAGGETIALNTRVRVGADR